MLKGYYVLSHLFERYLSIPTFFGIAFRVWARGGGGNTGASRADGAVSAKGKYVVDCGGHGQWGPNTLGYLLGLVDRATVIKHALVPAHRPPLSPHAFS
jgi:hypothetical protein